MSILIDEKTPILVQGITSEKATFHTKEMIAAGSQRRRRRHARQGRPDAYWRPGVQHRERGGEGDGRDDQHRFRRAGLRGRCDHGSGRRRPQARLLDHRRHSGAGHDAREALSDALSEGAAHHARRPELRRHHQPRQGDARHHAAQHLSARLRRHHLAFRHARL